MYMGFNRIELGLLLDGRGSTSVPHAAVLIEDDCILEVGPATTVSRPESAQVFEYHTATGLPGFIDCHAHVTMPGDGTSVEAVGEQDEHVWIACAEENTRACLKAGVTTVVDCGAPGNSIFAFKKAVAERGLLSPRLLVCGRPITATAGHGWPFGGEANGPDGMRRAVRELMKEGADFIKVMVSGGSTLTTSRSGTYLWEDELKAAVEEAHSWGRIVVAHATSVSAITVCVDVGVDVLAHATFYKPRSDGGIWPADPATCEDFGQSAFDPQIARRIADQSIPVVPTLWTNRVRITRMEKVAAERPLSEAEARELEARRRTYEERCDGMKGLADAGVLLGAGTDAGWGPPFDTYFEEIRAMSNAGLGLTKALSAATGDAARICGIEKAVGTLEPGKLADLVLLDGDPTHDESALESVVAVFLGGEQVV
jgi:imidazolonepropionase-like amidohydrolase